MVGNPDISSEAMQKIEKNFIKNPAFFSSPVGIDLGLNIYSSFFSPSHEEVITPIFDTGSANTSQSSEETTSIIKGKLR